MMNEIGTSWCKITQIYLPVLDSAPCGIIAGSFHKVPHCDENLKSCNVQIMVEYPPVVNQAIAEMQRKVRHSLKYVHSEDFVR